MHMHEEPVLIILYPCVTSLPLWNNTASLTRMVYLITMTFFPFIMDSAWRKRLYSYFDQNLIRFSPDLLFLIPGGS